MECQINGCDREAARRGWCNGHYLAWRRYGDPTIQKRRPNGSQPDQCVVDGCGRKPHANDMCASHDAANRRWGDPLESRLIRGDDEARFFLKIQETENGCWVWTGYKTPEGYPMFSAGGKICLAHRWAWEHFVGPIPDGFDVDHVCRNRACVRPHPEHLEPVDHAENVRRGMTGRMNHYNAAKTHCKFGHPFDEANTRITPSGSRHCRACNRRRMAERNGTTQIVHTARSGIGG